MKRTAFAAPALALIPSLRDRTAPAGERASEQVGARA